MLECPLYNYIRKRYISKYYWKYANIPNCIQLLTSNNKEWNIYIALFVQESFELKQKMSLKKTNGVGLKKKKI